MPLKTLRIFISSPGDVAEERLIARRVIGRIDSAYGDVVRLEAVFWEHQPLVATATFQDQLPVPSATDIVVAILWARLGTVLPAHIRRADGSSYASGTEFEFEDAVAGFRRAGKPDILTYRKTAKPDWSAEPELAADQVRQKRALDHFIAKWFIDAADGSLRAAFHSFESPADFEELLEAHLARLVERHVPAGGRDQSSGRTWRQGSPFRGLETFEFEHAAVFFGRTAAVASVLQKVRRQIERGKAFVLIVSTSGAGKSSLVRAGVLPLLLQPGVVADETLWRYAILKPSEGQGDPLRALRNALLQPTALAGLADGDPGTLSARIGAALDLLGTGSRLALVVDQLEELFSDERIDRVAREVFVAVLAALARGGRVVVLSTLRSDVYPRLAELPALIELKEGDGQFDLLAPVPREIAQIIRAPAAAAGLRFEVRAHTAERLDDTIRDAAARNPGALPLLEFLLEELYKRRSSEDVLTFRAYQELGGVEGALAQRAEQVVAGVSAAARDLLPTVFRELVALGVDEESRALRRTAPRAAFTSAAANELIDALIAARLLVSGANPEGGAFVALAHEALLEYWPRLADWREKNRENLLIHARLANAANVWEKQGRSQDFLLARGKPIADARSLVSDGVRLAPQELDLLAASEKRGRRFARVRAGAIAALALLAIAASVAAYFANVQSQRARTQATTAQRTTDFMVSLFSIADPEENRGATVTVREILDRGVTEIQNGLSGEQAVRANLLRAMGQAYNGLGLYPKANEILTQAVAAAEKSGIREDVLKVHLVFAANRYLQGDYKEAARVYRLALEEAGQLYGRDSASVTAAMTGLGDSVFELDQAEDAERLYRDALAIDLRLHGERHADSARTLNGLAMLLYYEGRYDDAEPYFRRALAVRRDIFGSQHAKVAESLNNLGSLLFQKGDYAGAAQIWGEALPLYRAVFGDRHRETATVLNNLGRVALLRNDLAAADRYLGEALTTWRELLGPDHDDLIVVLNSLGMVRLAQNRLAEAQVLLDDALRIARARKHWMLNQVLANLGDLRVAERRLEDAASAIDEARAVLAAQYGEALQGAEAWRTAVLDSIAAGLRTQQGRYDEAERSLLAALPVLEARFGSRSLYARQTLERLHNLYLRWGREAEAKRYAARIGTG